MIRDDFMVTMIDGLTMQRKRRRGAVAQGWTSTGEKTR